MEGLLHVQQEKIIVVYDLPKGSYRMKVYRFLDKHEGLFQRRTKSVIETSDEKFAFNLAREVRALEGDGVDEETGELARGEAHVYRVKELEVSPGGGG